MGKYTTRKDGYLKRTHNVNEFLVNLKRLEEAVNKYDREKKDYIFSYKKRIELSVQLAIADRLEKVVNTLMRSEGDLIESRKEKWMSDRNKDGSYKNHQKYDFLTKKEIDPDEYSDEDRLWDEQINDSMEGIYPNYKGGR
tara:strand:- start:43 stop:462 length:420 start_codon:yes stop_codon:yes gene_type:complete